jgi:RNA polymerase sigma factor (sigma-70 family)
MNRLLRRPAPGRKALVLLWPKRGSASTARDEEDSRTRGQLLERFLEGREEAAFEVLLRRHGPMVLGVCRRILSNAHDAEDAFQAAFLVLIRKGQSLRPRQTLGNWLYGVAYPTALKARAARWKRRSKERQTAAMNRPHPAREGTQNAWVATRNGNRGFEAHERQNALKALPRSDEVAYRKAVVEKGQNEILPGG